MMPLKWLSLPFIPAIVKGNTLKRTVVFKTGFSPKGSMSSKQLKESKTLENTHWASNSLFSFKANLQLNIWQIPIQPIWTVSGRLTPFGIYFSGCFPCCKEIIFYMKRWGKGTIWTHSTPQNTVYLYYPNFLILLTDFFLPISPSPHLLLVLFLCVQFFFTFHMWVIQSLSFSDLLRLA